MDRCHSCREMGESGSARKRTGEEVSCVCVIESRVGIDGVDWRRVFRIKDADVDETGLL
jgi:hypothetical protein